MTDKYDLLKIENQLCFPLYCCSKEVVRMYKPLLEEIDLTYTQYITMMILWEHKTISVKDLGNYLSLDSGTLTPVLKKLEQKGYITRERSKEDERVLVVTVTKLGENLKDTAISIPEKMQACVPLSREESLQLYCLLKKILEAKQEDYHFLKRQK